MSVWRKAGLSGLVTIIVMQAAEIRTGGIVTQYFHGIIVMIAMIALFHALVVMDHH